MRVGIFAKTFPRASMEASLDAVAANAIEAIQFNMALLGGPSLPGGIAAAAARRIREAVAARGLEMTAVSGTYNMAHPDPATRRRGQERLGALIAAARDLGTRIVTVCSGTRDPDDMWRAHPDNAQPEAWRDTVDSLAAAVPIAERHGVTLGIEPEPNNVVRDARAARRLIDELRSASLGIVIDAANLVAAGGLATQRPVLDEAVSLLGGEIVLAHAKDIRADGTLVAAGRGGLDYAHYVSGLARAGYDGPLVLHGLDEQEVPASAAFLRGAMTRVRG
jgi:sugar phosphate isomerase/epimerase